MIPVGSMSQSMSTTSTLAGAVAPAAAPPGFPNFQTIEAAELVFQKAIGSGAYGSVFLADWTGCQVGAGTCGLWVTVSRQRCLVVVWRSAAREPGAAACGDRHVFGGQTVVGQLCVRDMRHTVACCPTATRPDGLATCSSTAFLQVAVKQLHGLQGGIDPNSREYGALVNEVTLLGSLSHPNIMRFLAVST